jgi:phage terminase Nu1 subunit (DNA packaging protein)
MPAAELTISEAELAKLLGVTRPAVTQWRQDGCPFRKQGGRYEYVVSEVVDWRLARAKQTQRDELAPDEAREKARKARIDADLKEIELATARGEVVPIAEFRAELEGAYERVRAKLLALPGEHAQRWPELGAREATRRLRDLVDAILQDLEDGSDIVEDEPEEEAA